ncbi:hypothetical protein, partial [Blastococcus sp. MG754427]|uniref:hypothetical protein n=1 Tax=Blastococcus sp. MG754427 TaxID=2570318 RepID=UPI001F47E780
RSLVTADPRRGLPPALASPRVSGDQGSTVNRDLHDLQGVLGQAQGKGLLSPQEAQQAYGQAVAGAYGPELQQVDTRYVPAAVTKQQLIGLVGEQTLFNALAADGLVVFHDWTKHVAGNGIDLVAFHPSSGEVWLLDNKAQLRGISAAGALTGPQFEGNLAAVRAWLAGPGPKDTAAAQKAIAAIDAKKFRKVVSNGFAGAATTFTKSLFESAAVEVYDLRISPRLPAGAPRLFTDHAAWKAAFSSVPKGIGRIAGHGGAVFDGALLVLALAGATAYAVRDAENIAKSLGDVVLQTGFDLVLSRLPGGFFAGLVVGLETDNPQALRALRIDELCQTLPGYDAWTDAERAAVAKVVGELLDDPLVVEVPRVPVKVDPLPFLDADRWLGRSPHEA